MKEKRYPFLKRFRKRGDDGEMNDVYAGPEYFERPAPDSDPEDAPLPPDEENEKPHRSRSNKEIECVYAGPEYFENNEPPIQPVYAGPEYFQPEDQPIMLVYAGPEYFRQDSPSIRIVPSGETAPKGVDSGFLCPACGKPAKQNDRYCANCGMPLNQSDDNA